MDRRQFVGTMLTATRYPARKALGADDRPWRGLRIGIISDEVDTDFESALKWIKTQQMKSVELRNLWGTYVTDLREADVERAKDLLARYNLNVSVVDSAFLKATLPGTDPLPDDQMEKPFGTYPFPEHEALLLRAFEKARAFRTDRVRIFSFWRVPNPREIFDRVKTHLVRAVALAEKAGISLLLENESACNVGTGAELSAMLNSVPSKYLSGLWDPGNAFTAGENPYPEGYGKLDRNRIRHIHLKDAVRDRATKSRTWVPIGSGEIDIKGQLRALMRDKYLEGISVETHYVPKNGTPAQGSLESIEGLRKILTSL